MGLLDDLMNQATGGQTNAGGLGGLLSMVTSNPQVVSALAGLLSTRDTSVGGVGGLGGIISAFQQNGLGDVVSKWISTGPNPPVSSDQVTQALGHDTLSQFASKAGVPVSEAGSLLAGLLPAAVDHLTPAGTVPDANTIEQSLSSLISGLRR
jgi:uncharacterized protein YidB (DUF937 family)